MSTSRPGITVVHRRGCTYKLGGCNCRPGYRAEAYDHVTQRRRYKTHPTLKAALVWRQDTQVAIRRGEVRVTRPVTLAEVWQDWQLSAVSGTAMTKSGKRYKPSVVRGYRGAWFTKIEPALGRSKVAEIRPVHVKRLVQTLLADGYAPSTVRNTVTALRVLFKWAISEELASSNPCDDVALPSGGTTRDNIVPVETALKLVDALPTPREKALWATAFFAGLRRGELAGLEWADVDLEARSITVRRSYDPGGRTMVSPKSKAGSRTLGFPALLTPFLAALEHREELVFGRPEDHSKPFVEKGITKRADEAWAAAGLDRLTLHECRHTYASLMIAANVNMKTIQTWIGHSSITVTLDLHGHLLPGSVAEALGLIDAYLEREVGSRH